MIGESPADIPSNLVPYILQVAMGKLENLWYLGGITHKGWNRCCDYIHVMILAEGHGCLSFTFFVIITLIIMFLI